jgi:hypothetical protein
MSEQRYNPNLTLRNLWDELLAGGPFEVNERATRELVPCSKCGRPIAEADQICADIVESRRSARTRYGVSLDYLAAPTRRVTVWHFTCEPQPEGPDEG